MSSKIKAIFCFLICFSLHASAETTVKKDKASHSAAKAAAMKYLSERKPAQETLSSIEDMRTEMNNLMMFLVSDDATPRDKVQAIHTSRYRLGLGLKALIIKTPDNNSPVLKEAYRYDDTMIYLSELKLDPRGAFTKNGCNSAVSMISVHGYSPSAEGGNPDSNEVNALDVVKKLCSQ